jgi:SNF2 family DNA or RNA helicase
MENPFVCLGVVYCPLSNSKNEILVQLFQKPKTYWACLTPHEHGVAVHIPKVNMPVGYIPFPLSSIFLEKLNSPTKYGPLGGYQPGQIPTPDLFVECLLRVECKPMATINLAITIFVRESNIGNFLNQFIKSHIFPQAPKNYQPSQHLGCKLAALPQNLISSDRIINKSFDPNLLTIPSGCDLHLVYPPQEIIKTKLLPHQAQGLSFMIERESPHSMSAQSLWTKSQTGDWHLWESKINRTYIGFSNSTCVPENPLGSILADEMGLGKSLQAISLIATSLRLAKEFSTKILLSEKEFPHSHATLIVCPAQLINNWSEEILKHVHKGSMQHLKYHGPQRHMISNTSMESANIIITSYEIVRAEFNQIQISGSSDNSLIFSRFWFRVVLDEAQ